MNKKILIAVPIIIIIVLLVMVFKTESSKDTPESKAAAPTSSEVVEKASKQLTIAQQWQWLELQKKMDKDSNKNQSGSGSDEPLPFNAQSVHDALSAVKIDENGDIVFDNDALIALDEALERIYNRLDAESILTLEDLIRDALPGKVGEQTAKIVRDYNEFLKAKEQFSLLHENTVYNGGEQTVQTIESDQSLYSELQSLREVHLGRDVTQSLFSEHDATAEFMFDSMKLGLDDSLTPEVREQRRQEIESKYREVIPLEEQEIPAAEN